MEAGWFGVADLSVTTESLGEARIVQQAFENPDGTPLTVQPELFDRCAHGVPVWSRGFQAWDFSEQGN